MKEFVGEQVGNENSLMWEYLNQEEYDYQRPERGEIRDGVVLRKDPHEIVLDIGVKLDAVVPDQDLEKLDPEELAAINVGDTIAVFIIQTDDPTGRIQASLTLAKSQGDWTEAERMMEDGSITDTEVEGFNKGGLIVPFGLLRGFIPASQVMGLVQRTDSGSRADRLEQMVGRKLKVKVIEVSQKRRRLIMSERAAMKEWRAENKGRLLDELKVGDVRKGVVTNLMNFGAFVDLGGADGLVHVSELSWQRVKHPKDVMEVGQEVEVYVLGVDRAEERIALSMKRLQADPWSQVASKYTVGDIVESEITNLTDFGAFARIEAGIEGLIHLSELSEQRAEHPREIVHRGQRVTLRIISIDTERQRIGLSLKRAPQPVPEPVEEVEEVEEQDHYVDSYDELDEQGNDKPTGGVVETLKHGVESAVDVLRSGVARVTEVLTGSSEPEVASSNGEAADAAPSRPTDETV